MKKETINLVVSIGGILILATALFIWALKVLAYIILFGICLGGFWMVFRYLQVKHFRRAIRLGKNGMWCYYWIGEVKYRGIVKGDYFGPTDSVLVIKDDLTYSREFVYSIMPTLI